MYVGQKTAIFSGSSWVDNQAAVPIWTLYPTRCFVTLYGAVGNWQTCSNVISDGRFPQGIHVACAEVFGSFTYKVQYQVLHGSWIDPLIWFVRE